MTQSENRAGLPTEVHLRRTKVGKLVLIMGPSGVGKSVILLELRKRRPDLVFPKSATTRPQREHENQDLYHFVSESAFDRLIAEHKLLEWAQVHQGARYGTLIEEILPPIEAGKIVVREVDVQGFESIRHHSLFSGDHPQYTLQSIFILPESQDILIERIKKRAPMSDTELEKRMESMRKELAYAQLCDVQVMNKEGKLTEAIEQTERAIGL